MSYVGFIFRMARLNITLLRTRNIKRGVLSFGYYRKTAKAILPKHITMSLNEKYIYFSRSLLASPR